MSREFKMMKKNKVSKFDRLRGPNLILEKWTNAKAAIIGYYVGKGMVSTRIARTLDDGTSSQDIRQMCASWRLPTINGQRRIETIAVPFTARQRETIFKSAEAIGIPVETYIQNISYLAAKDDLYNAIVDEH